MSTDPLNHSAPGSATDQPDDFFSRSGPMDEAASAMLHGGVGRRGEMQVYSQPSIGEPQILSVIREMISGLKGEFSTDINRLQNFITSEVSDILDERLGQFTTRIIASQGQRSSSRQAKNTPASRARSCRKEVHALPDGIEEILSRQNQTWSILATITKRLSADLRRVTYPGAADASIPSGCFPQESALGCYLFSKKRFADKRNYKDAALGNKSICMMKDITLRLLLAARMSGIFLFPHASNSKHALVPMPEWLFVHFLSAARNASKDINLGCSVVGGSASFTDTINLNAAGEIFNNLNPVQKEAASKAEGLKFVKTVSCVFNEFYSYKRKKAESTIVEKEAAVHNVKYQELISTFEEAVREVKRETGQSISTGRHKARVCLFKSFGFILEYLDMQKTTSSNAFGISVPGYTTEEEKILSSLENLHLGIGKPSTSTSEDLEELAAIDEDNLNYVETLKAKFPALTCTLWYEAEVKLEAAKRQRTDNGRMTHEPDVLRWKEVENVSLIVVAMRFLMEAGRADSYGTLLRASTDSIRAIFVVALALRAIIKKQTNNNLNAAESAVLGNIVLHERAKKVPAGKGSEELTQPPEMDFDKSRERNESYTFLPGLFILDEETRSSKITERLTLSKADYNNFMAREKEDKAAEEREASFRNNVRESADSSHGTNDFDLNEYLDL